MLVILHRSKLQSCTMKSTVLLTCLAVSVGVLAATDLKSDEQGQAATPSGPDASDKFIGREAGQVRDDNGLKMKLVWCPPGKFRMGSPPSEQGPLNDEGQVNVTLTNGFWLGKYEVTQSEWKQAVQTEPWKGKFTNEGEDFPATYISWNDAMEFCRKLTEQERQAGRLPNDWEYTLPTEAQWERACRARTETRFSFGDDESKLGDYAWFGKNASPGEYAHRVGQKKANPWGLHDMHGNLWEWCRDIYTNKLPGGRDPEVKPDENTRSFRVHRGGSWSFGAAHCRSGFRSWYQPDGRISDYGFRPALTPSTAAVAAGSRSGGGRE
jgi:formylglycine-generating enzyme required for sulfatase activity